MAEKRKTPNIFIAENQTERDIRVSGRIILKRAPNTTYTVQFLSTTSLTLCK
jgi:hypothetical protein